MGITSDNPQVSPQFSRRRLLALGALGSIGALVACQGAPSAPTSAPAPTLAAAKPAEAPRPAATAATGPAGKEEPKAKPPAAGLPERKLPSELTTMPKPGEIPAAPGGGIGIDEMDKK